MTKKDIHRICKKYKIENYTINEDLSIDVDGSVNLRNNYLTELPLKFRNVAGHLDCTNNQLTSLEDVPSYIGGGFYFSYNQLTSLEGELIVVGGNFHCSYNPLESLKGIPLNLSENKLYLPYHFTYSDYIAYCRNLKFEKILK